MGWLMIHETRDHASRGDNLSQHRLTSTGRASLWARRRTHEAWRRVAPGAKLSGRLLVLLVAVSVVCLGWVLARAYGQIAVRNQGYVPYSDAPINYRSEDLSDPVAILQQELNQGKQKLKYEPKFGYLKSVLKLLKVPVDSQTLVFSKTSFQYKKISPEHPRALYFNDDVYVGKVHDGKAIEIVSFDPMQGAIFYLLDEHKVDKPVFQRAELDCTQCHIAAGTHNVPGVLLRSIYPTTTGTQAPASQSYITDQESPIKDRWGGWYVTGKISGLPHMANAVVEDRQTAGQPDQGASIKLVSLSNAFDSSAYLTSQSDVVAHLVLAHQTQMHNLITLTNYKTRMALYAEAARNKSDGSAAGAPLSEAARKQFERPAEQLLRYLLFVNEAPLSVPGGEGVEGSSSYRKEFEARGVRDAEGRSLRDFDLKTRLFRYPCSYLIYSASFDALPEPAKGYVYHRLLEVLSGEDKSGDFSRLSAEDRRAVLEILLATKPGLPAEWEDYARLNHISVHASAKRSRPS